LCQKDAILLEDKTRSRNPALVGTLAMLRNILLFTHKEQEKHVTLPGFVEDIAADNNKAFFNADAPILNSYRKTMAIPRSEVGM